MNDQTKTTKIFLDDVVSVRVAVSNVSMVVLLISALSLFTQFATGFVLIHSFFALLFGLAASGFLLIAKVRP